MAFFAVSKPALASLEQLSVHQDYFWFVSLLAWSLALIVWWRHPRRRTGWSWFPAAASAAIASALVQFGTFNPTFDIFQDRLVPGTVSNYKLALIDPYWLGDVLIGFALAALGAAWWRLVLRSARGPALRWLPVVVFGALGLQRLVEPVSAGVGLAALVFVGGLLLWRIPESDRSSRTGLVLAALLPALSTIGPLAAALDMLRRIGPPQSIGLIAAAFQASVASLTLACLTREMFVREIGPDTAEFRRVARPFVLGGAALLVAGVLFAIQTGRDNRREIFQNRLRQTAGQARTLPPALMAPLLDPKLRIVRHPDRPAPDATCLGWSDIVAAGALRPLEHKLVEFALSTPFIDGVRLVILHDGWLVAVAATPPPGPRGTVAFLRPATAADHARAADREPYVESSAVPEIGHHYYTRGPIVGPDGRVLGWLDEIRSEYYLSVERRWRAAPLVMTALGLVLLALVLMQQWSTRRRLAALRVASLAAEASRIKTGFLANVSHELRTPLQSILGYCELLRPRLADAEQRAWLDALRQQGGLMTRLVNDLIDLSAVEAGSFRLVAQPENPAAVIRETVAGLRPRAEAKGLRLELEVDPGVPDRINLDAARVRQIVLNLAGNAIKFTDRGSVTITLRSAPTPGGAVELSLDVRDTGPGIPPAEQRRLFTPFTRLDRTADKEGSGLGLALSAALCRAIGGDLIVTSDGRTGSCFTATMHGTLATAPAIATVPGSVPTSVAPRVLVVDDNRLVRELFVASLAAQGARCRFAGTAAAALARVGEEAPDAIVLDLALPDGDGAALVPELRERAPGVRIVGVSAHAGAADRNRALAAGMDQFLVKPVTLSQLWAAVTAAPAGAPHGFEPPAELKRRLTEQFLAELPARRAELESAVHAADWPRVRAVSHYLRNSALVVRAAALLEACTGLETAATVGRTADVSSWWHRCRGALDRLEAGAQIVG